MTPEERAKQLIDRLQEGSWWSAADFAEIIRAAIAEEREACAAIVVELADLNRNETQSGKDDALFAGIAAAIRGRP